MNILEMEIAIANYFDYRRNLIIPNVWYGIGLNHEVDVLIFTDSGYAYEVEIKTSVRDLKRDGKKGHGHYSDQIRFLFFAIPETLKAFTEYIPENAGIIIIHEGGYCHKLRQPKLNKMASRFTMEKRFKLAHLASMRIWTLKRKLKDKICKEDKNAEEAGGIGPETDGPGVS